MILNELSEFLLQIHGSLLFSWMDDRFNDAVTVMIYHFESFLDLIEGEMMCDHGSGVDMSLRQKIDTAWIGQFRPADKSKGQPFPAGWCGPEWRAVIFGNANHDDLTARCAYVNGLPAGRGDSRGFKNDIHPSSTGAAEY